MYLLTKTGEAGRVDNLLYRLLGQQLQISKLSDHESAPVTYWNWFVWHRARTYNIKKKVQQPHPRDRCKFHLHRQVAYKVLYNLRGHLMISNNFVFLVTW